MKLQGNRWVYGLTLIGVAVVAWAYIERFALVERYHDYLQDRAAIEQAEAELLTLHAEYERLKEQNHQLGSDPLAREASIRRIQRKVRPGETVYHFEDGALSPSHAPEAVTAAPE